MDSPAAAYCSLAVSDFGRNATKSATEGTKRAADSQEGDREDDRVGGSVDEPGDWIPVLPACPAPAQFVASGPIWL